MLLEQLAGNTLPKYQLGFYEDMFILFINRWLKNTYIKTRVVYTDEERYEES